MVAVLSPCTLLASRRLARSPSDGQSDTRGEDVLMLINDQPHFLLAGIGIILLTALESACLSCVWLVEMGFKELLQDGWQGGINS